MKLLSGFTAAREGNRYVYLQLSFVRLSHYRNIILKLASLVVLMLKIYTQVGETCETSPEMCCKQVRQLQDKKGKKEFRSRPHAPPNKAPLQGTVTAQILGITGVVTLLPEK